ncbi:MAG: hypothetical protein AAF414_00630 [Pseudomonadota bacterium]
MVTLLEKAQELVPTLVISREDDETPIDVDAALPQMRLNRLQDGTSLQQLGRGQIDFTNATFANIFNRLAMDPESQSFLTADLMGTTDFGSAFSGDRYQTVRGSIGGGVPAYVTLHENVADLVANRPAFVEDLDMLDKAGKYSMITYHFYFLRQNGVGFRTYPFEREGHWTGVSVLLHRDTKEPHIAGFHGLAGIRFLRWDDVNRLFGHIETFVGVGTHSLFEREGEFPTEVKVWPDDPDLGSLNLWGPVVNLAAGAFAAGGLLLEAGVAAGILGATGVAAAPVVIGIALGLAIIGLILSGYALYRIWSHDDSPSWQAAAYRPEDSQAIAMEQANLDDSAWAEPADVAVERATELVPKNGNEVVTTLADATGEPWWGTFLAWGEQEVGSAQNRPTARPGLLQPSLDHSFLMGALRLI